MLRKTGRYRLAPNGDCVALQIEVQDGGVAPRPDSRRWVWATPQDLADLITVTIKPAALQVGAA